MIIFFFGMALKISKIVLRNFRFVWKTMIDICGIPLQIIINDRDLHKGISAFAVK